MIAAYKKNYLLHGLFLTFILASCAQKDIKTALKKINEDTLRARISYISDDTTAGRAPGSEGSLIALRYIAKQMQQAGLKPGIGDSSYYQHFNIVKTDVDPKMELIFSGNHEKFKPAYYQDFILFPGVQQENIAIDNAELVFAGYGIQASEYNWDDFKGADLQGKILLIMNNDPDTGNPDFFGGEARLYYGRWDYKYDQAAKMGAAGAIIIHTTESAAYPWQVVQTSWSGSQFQLYPETNTSFKCKGWITKDAANKVAEMAGYQLFKLQDMALNKDFKPIPLGIKVSCSLHATFNNINGTNVMGYLPGSDPELSRQAVVVTAHHDHLGVGKKIRGDSIYNGALDNASGVSSILGLADAFSSLKTSPRRTLVFLTVDGEESGLLGSWYYVQHPTFPAENIAANVNIDFINILGKTRDIILIGKGKSSIDDIVTEYAMEQNRYVLPDQQPESGMFYRSDQFSFAKAGIPGLYLNPGQDVIGQPEGWGKTRSNQWLDDYYHQPDDEYKPSWDLSGQMEDLQLLFNVINKLANQDDMPEWSLGAEFKRTAPQK
jgi:Zn-dependent M28 family amino/carboxypeptidase